MDKSVVTGLCRLTIHAPGTRFDLALPTDIPVADLLPTVVSFTESPPAGPDLDQGGWALQRLGEEPLDGERTLDSFGLHDGEALYLRPLRDTIPPVHFDDLVDGIATGLAEREDSWRPTWTHRMLVVQAAIALLVGFVAVFLPGPRLTRIGAAAVVALFLLLGAAAASRALGDSIVGTVLGAATVPFAWLVGYLLPNDAGAGMLGSRLLSGSSVGAGAAVLALAAVAACAPAFLGLALIACAGVLSGLIMLFGHASPPSAMALVAVVVVLLGAFAPSLAFRLSGLRLPPLPADAEQLQEGIDPHPSRDVLARSTVADDYLTGFYAAIAVVCAASVTTLAGAPGWPGRALAAALSVLLLLHARAVGSRWHRLAMVAAGGYGTALLVLQSIWSASPGGRIVLLVGSLLTATALLVAAWSVPGRRLVPYWGRAADLLHSVTALSLLPLAMGVCGLYQFLRALNG